MRARGISEIVVGPVHAGIIEPGRFTLSTYGETIARIDVQLGFAHRGVEAYLAGMPAREAARYLARVCGACSVARSWAYARAVEHLAGERLGDAAEIARLCFAELERIYNHIFDLGSMCAGAGYGFGRTASLGLKERVHRVCEHLSGHRFMFDALVPGGVQMPRGSQGVRSELRAIRDGVERLVNDALANDSVRSRFERTGALSLQGARELGGVGPALRACGDARDVRLDEPYGAYARMAPAVAVQTQGDVLARLRVRADELRESFRLVDDACEVLAAEPAQTPRTLCPAAGSAIGVVEGARGAEEVFVECDASGNLQRVGITSASSRNWPLVVRAMDANIVPDFPLVNKSFNLCYACADK